MHASTTDVSVLTQTTAVVNTCSGCCSWILFDYVFNSHYLANRNQNKLTACMYISVEGIHFDDDVDFLVCEYYLLVYIVLRFIMVFIFAT